MRFLQAPSASSKLLSTFALILSLRHAVVANPVYALVHSSVILVERQGCQNPCGYEGWLCCGAGQQCFTDSNNQAQCGTPGPVTEAAGGGEGYWQYWTSTWVETNLVTRTSIYSSFVGATAQTNPTAVCNIPCGQNCCGWGQYCLNSGTGQCANAGGTTQATVSPTTTVPFESAIPTGQDVPVGAGAGGGLSGGAIAGIVIGVLAGIILLILLCLFCCARGIFNTIMAIFGLGKKRRVREETYIESHHSGTVGGGRRWYGQGPARPPKEKKSGFGGLGAAGAVLGTLALALGLKRRHDKKHDEKSDYTSSYTYSDYTSTSSASSDRRTRQTRHSSRR